nr:MAG TPA: protein of unknown function (DUF5048) [Caudoviricetes sp.]
MKYVSPAYQKAINLHRSQGIRNQMHAKINFGIIDQYAFDDATITVSPGVSFSDISGIQTGVNDVAESYASWEQDFWQLNGRQRFLDTQTPYDTGYISTAISGEDGTFSANPYIDITFSTLHSMVGITLQFDTVTGTCPSDFTVTAYDGSTLKNTWEITGNTDVIYQGELGIENADHIRIEFTKTRPYNRIRVNSMLFGIAYSFSGEDIISITHNRAASPLSTELPAESLNFTLFNEDGRYNIDSSFSVITFLQKEQQVTVQYGYDVDGQGTIEWLSPSTYWLQSWETDGINAAFSCSDIFSRLNATTYKKGDDSFALLSLSSLAADVLTDAGISDYWVNDVELQNTKTNLPLPYDTHANCLQLIANLGKSTLEQNSAGGIEFRYRDEPGPADMSAETQPQVPQTVYSYYNIDRSRTGGVFSTQNAPDYATWEENFFSLDGNMAFLPEGSPYQNTGYVSNIFPNENGYYPEPSLRFGASITLHFGVNITFGKLFIDIGSTSSQTLFSLAAYRNMSAADAEEQVYQQVFSIDSASGEWENGLLAFTGNFDRVERIDIFPIFSQNQQRARIKRVAVDYVQPFEITSDDILGNPKGELLEKCSKVVYNAVSFSTTSQTPDEPVSTVTVSPNVLTEVKNSDIYYNQRFESENSGITISEEEHYAYCSFLKISGTNSPAEIQWFANVVEEMPEVPYESDIGDLGEVCEFNNPIASNAESRQDVADWMADYLSKRRQYTVETLGYPEVDPGDLILYNGQQATVTEANISFQQGAMKETFTLRGETKIGNMANT